MLCLTSTTEVTKQLPKIWSLVPSSYSKGKNKIQRRTRWAGRKNQEKIKIKIEKHWGLWVSRQVTQKNAKSMVYINNVKIL